MRDFDRDSLLYSHSASEETRALWSLGATLIVSAWDSVSYLQPFLVRGNLDWIAEGLKMIFIIVALLLIYGLDWAIAFSISALGYAFLLSPVFLALVTPVDWNTHQRAIRKTTVMKEFQGFASALDLAKIYSLMNQHELRELVDKLTLDAEKDDKQAQYVCLALNLPDECPY